MSDSEEEPRLPPPIPTPDSMVLYDFLGAGHYDRVITESDHFLNEDPEDYHAHNNRALALVQLKRLREAETHVEFLLKAEPDWSTSYSTAGSLYLRQKNWAKLIEAAEEGQRLDPYDSTFPMFLAIALGSRMKIQAAQVHMDRARELDPNNPDVINLQARFGSINNTSARASLERVDTLRSALQHDPGNENLHCNLGEIFLDELDDPRQAEYHFREALRADPSEKEYQRGLFESIARRSPLYRVISIPSRTFGWLKQLAYAIGHQPWRILFLLMGFKMVIAFFIWLAAVTILFWPACKVYEWLLVSEIKSGSAASLGEIKTWSWFQRIPFLVRFLLFIGVSLLGYLGLFQLFNIPYASGFNFLGIFTGVHVAFVFLFWCVRLIRRSVAQARKRKAVTS